MAIKLIVLKSGETLITEAKQLVSKDEENKVHSYIFSKPHTVKISKSESFNVPLGLSDMSAEEVESKLQEKAHEYQINLSPWILLAKDEDIHVQLDWVVTIVDPVESLKTMYEEKISG